MDHHARWLAVNSLGECAGVPITTFQRQSTWPLLTPRAEQLADPVTTVWLEGSASVLPVAEILCRGGETTDGNSMADPRQDPSVCVYMCVHVQCR